MHRAPVTMGLADTPVPIHREGAEAAARSIVANGGAPGAVVAVLDSDGGVKIAAAGERVAGGSDPVLRHDPFHVGSLTKAMTATLAARLVEAGAISWNSTVGDVLESRLAVPPVYADVTLDALLRHRAGIVANIRLMTTLRLVAEEPRREDRTRYIEAALAARRRSADKFRYSNAGYVIAGAMLEEAGGASWEELILRELFAPLRMKGAGFGPPQGAAPVGHRRIPLLGLRPAGQGVRADNVPALGPAGRVHLPASAMLRFLRAHLTRDGKLLTEASWTRLQIALPNHDYSMGWAIAEQGRLTHSGSNTMWFATMTLDRMAGRAVFAAVNSGDLRRVAPRLEAAVGRLLQ